MEVSGGLSVMIALVLKKPPLFVDSLDLTGKSEVFVHRVIRAKHTYTHGHADTHRNRQIDGHGQTYTHTLMHRHARTHTHT